VSLRSQPALDQTRSLSLTMGLTTIHASRQAVDGLVH
jgi:hypothetical protein